MIHTGSSYIDITGCLIPIGAGYTQENEDFDINGELKTLTIFHSGGTSSNKLLEINKYINERSSIANEQNKKFKIVITINR